MSARPFWRVCLAMLPALVSGCNCYGPTEAACVQTLVALCELEETCFGGVPLDTCVADRPDFTCTVDVAESGACVDAINAQLASGCVDAATTVLPCPELDQAGLYGACGGQQVCAADRTCFALGEADRLCSIDCEDGDTCPEAGGCFLAGGFCLPECSATAFCDFDSACVDNRCELCSDLCAEFGRIEGCNCTAGLACFDDSDCDVACNPDGLCA